MQTGNPILDDLARVASGALSALGGVREEVETRFKERLERLAADMDLATREELDAAKAMAQKARAAQEELEGRVAALEAALAELRSAPTAEEPAPAKERAPRKRTTKRTSTSESAS
ncbi:MAG TPA: accessory factor UbiK family protein [Geminicoccaceae bacterium]|nr:accessory factor UbiK family protein [Geminicoccaceae bacterium]